MSLELDLHPNDMAMQLTARDYFFVLGPFQAPCRGWRG